MEQIARYHAEIGKSCCLGRPRAVFVFIFPGTQCTICHDHDNYFQPTITAEHPQAVTDCGNCHPQGRPAASNLLEIHEYDCQQCHRDLIYERTILGGPGTFQGECNECHNPDRAETGNLQIHTKGHRCVVCHGRQMPTGKKTEFHKEHVKTANCVVCHGFIPAMGTGIESGSREICRLCHEGPVDGTRITTIHREMVPAGLSCLECHGDARPPIDVIPGAPVGDAGVVCEICHDGRSPALFSYRSERLHRRHAEKQLDCGVCHADASLQDDRQPMPEPDDYRRQLVNRSGEAECRFCHQAGRRRGRRWGRNNSRAAVHRMHAAGQRQWCYNCHEGSDGRPPGLVPPVTQPSEACRLCHNRIRYNGAIPFQIHIQHAGISKCYTCHQTRPQLLDWPEIWLAGT